MKEPDQELFARGLLELGIRLTPGDLKKLQLLAAEVQKWGRKINLTAIHGDADIAVKHFLDSLTLLKIVGRKGRLLDLGSGAGFPAFPLKIASHELEVVAVDAVEKKIIFQRHAARLLQLHGFEAVHARAEELTATYAGSFDWVVSRAFSDIPTFARMALTLIKDQGKIIAMKGGSGRAEANADAADLREIGVRVTEIVEFRLPVSGDARSLVVMERALIPAFKSK